MVFTDKKLAQYVIQLCKHKEIKHVVISPEIGSLNDWIYKPTIFAML